MPKRASLTTSLDGVKSALAASAAGNSELEARVTAAKKHADDRRKKQEKLQAQWSDLEKREVVGREDKKDLDARVRASSTRASDACLPRDQHHHETLKCGWTVIVTLTLALVCVRSRFRTWAVEEAGGDRDQGV